MKNIKSIFTALSLLFLFSTCTNDSPTEPDSNFLNTTWTLQKFDINGEIIEPPEDQTFNITFEENGTFTGLNDCNYMGGKYNRGDNHSLRLFDIYATEIGCGPESMDYMFMAALSTTTGYEIKGNKLYMYYNKLSRLVFITEE